jgi:hypothetical protein
MCTSLKHQKKKKREGEPKFVLFTSEQELTGHLVLSGIYKPMSTPRFFILVEPASSGTGLPVRFDRELEETGEIQFSIQNPSSIGLDYYTDRYDRYTGPVRPGTGRWTKKIESVENLTCFQIWIKKIEKI